jgi:hypothetical protein
MTTASRLRGVAVALVGVALLAACTGSTDDTAVPISTASSFAPAPEPTATPTPAPTPPPLTPGTARGRLVVVQQADDAALVSGGTPIRLTLARTSNVAAWFTAPPQKLAGTMSTEEALLTLGWRPAEDGTTSPLPVPRPNALLAFAGGSLAFTVQRANVRSDGTLVLDIRPIGAVPETVQSYGPVSLTINGAPGVLELGGTLGELVVSVVVTGEANEQAVISVRDDAGDVRESGFVSADQPTIERWLDIRVGETTWINPVVTLTPPTRGKPGTVRVTGTLTVDGVTTELDSVVARWSLPLS